MGIHSSSITLCGIPSMSGARDIELGANTNELVTELLWDIIYLTEHQFLLPYYHGEHKKFQKKLVKRVGNHLNSLVNNSASKPTGSMTVNVRHVWRNVGDRYTLLYLPLYFKELIWCKANGSIFHVIIPHTKDHVIHEHKEWLLAILEMAGYWNLSHVRLYLPRDDLTNIQTLLKNLHWIGANLLPNENRNECNENDDITLSDETYIILECEC